MLRTDPCPRDPAAVRTAICHMTRSAAPGCFRYPGA